MTKLGQPRSQPAAMVVLGGALALSACAVRPPSGPTVMAVPSTGKSLQAFRQDDVACRSYAAQQIGERQPGKAATTAAAGDADLQRRYDVAYIQCVYSRGDTVRSLPGDYGYADYPPLAYGYDPFYGSDFGLGYPWGFWPPFAFGIGDGDFDHPRGFDHDFDDRGGFGHRGRR